MAGSLREKVVGTRLGAIFEDAVQTGPSSVHLVKAGFRIAFPNPSLENVQLRQCRHAGKLNYCTPRIAGGHACSLNGVRQARQTSERAVRCNTLALRTECCMMQVSCREGLGKNNPCSCNLKLRPQSPRGALISQRTVSTFRCEEPGDMQWYQLLFIEPFSVTTACCCVCQVCVVKEVPEHSGSLCPSRLRIMLFYGDLVYHHLKSFMLRPLRVDKVILHCTPQLIRSLRSTWMSEDVRHDRSSEALALAVRR